jgi:hypothetical protein
MTIANSTSGPDAEAEREVAAVRKLQGDRAVFEEHWEDIADVLWPQMKDTFRAGIDQRPKGEKKTEFQLDSTPQIALGQFAAIMDSLLTPRNQTWHGLIPQDPDLMKNRQVQLYYEQVTNVLFRMRYSSTANFVSQNQLVYQSLGAWGTGALYVDPHWENRGIRYKHCHIGEIFLRENHQGIVDTVYRFYRMTARQAAQAFGIESLPDKIRGDAADKPDREHWFLHVVKPNEQFDPNRLDARGMRFASLYLAVNEKHVIRRRGYETMPYIIPRYVQIPGEQFGRSPGMMALPAIKTLMAQKKAVLKQAHRTVDPVLLVHDDGLIDEVSLRPGALNKGGVNADGRPMIQTLPVGRVDVGLEMMDQERNAINMAFLVNLFELAAEDVPDRMTATQVIERTKEKGILLAPTVGRQMSEYLGPMIEREIDVAAQLGMLPEMPAILREARAQYEVEYDSPLSRAMKAEQVAGFMRTAEIAMGVAQATGDPSHLDPFNFRTAMPEIARINGAPVSWMNGVREMQVLAERRAAQQQQAANIEAAKAQAQVAAAQSKVEK